MTTSESSAFQSDQKSSAAPIVLDIIDPAQAPSSESSSLEFEDGTTPPTPSRYSWMLSAGAVGGLNVTSRYQALYCY